jgi:hypothetical protein
MLPLFLFYILDSLIGVFASTFIFYQSICFQQILFIPYYYYTPFEQSKTYRSD